MPDAGQAMESFMYNEPRRVRAEDLYALRTVAGCDLSPDGRHAAYTVRRVCKSTQQTYSDIWVADTDGGGHRPFTAGDWADSGPKFSPDGSRLAFLSDRDGGRDKQLYLIPFDGGEARRLTDVQGRIDSFDWSPDGERIVFEFRPEDTDDAEAGGVEDETSGVPVERWIERVYYRLDGVGYWPKSRQHLWTVEIDAGTVRQLTSGDDYDEHSPCWTPDGKNVVFVSNRCDEPDLRPDEMDLYMTPANGGELQRIEAPLGPKSLPSVSPCGRWVAYVGYEGANSPWKNAELWVASPDGSEAARSLTGAFDIAVGNDTISERGDGPATRPIWAGDSERVFFQVTRRGRTQLCSVTLDGALETVLDHDGIVGEFGFDRERSTVAWVDVSERSPGEVQAANGAGDAWRRISSHNDELMGMLDLGGVEEVWFPSPGGGELQGWILKPPGFDPSKSYPSIMQIHGGPWAQYGNVFMHEFQYLAAHDYVVYFCNPRGGRGYGEAHASAIREDWGGADYDDLMAWADYAQGLPYVDEERMGVTGGSYGGFMTNWIIGHTDRFKAAVTQRSVVNLVDFYGTSDTGWVWEPVFSGSPPWEDFESYWRQSPLRYVGNALTPTLIIHSENDLRCPISQGEQLFTALKRLGVETELVRFPEESHGLSRGGRTDRRIRRLNHILRWFERHLKR